jgi:streptogramin lyase
LKCPLHIAVLVVMVMAISVPCTYADLFVDSWGSNNYSVLRYNEMTGDFIDFFVSSGSGGLDSPKGVIVGRDGHLYVSSSGSNSVLRYDGTTGAPLPAPGKPDAVFVDPGDGGLRGPVGLLFGRDGNLYVSSQLTNSVLRYSRTTGDFLDEFVPAGSGGLDFPRGIVFGPDGHLYVNSSNNRSVMRYDGTTGDALPASGQTGAIFASGLAQVGPGVTFGPDGNLYVADFTHSSVARVNGTTGEFLNTFVSPGSGGLSGTAGLIFGPDNNLYVLSQNNNSVRRYDGSTGAFIDTFVGSGSGGLSGALFFSFTNTDPMTLAYVPPPSSRFLITASTTAISGTPFDLTVMALDPSGSIDTNYQGTVTFSTSDPDSGVVLPADYTFTTGDGGDNGVHTFSGAVTLITVGDQMLTSTDTVSGITGSVTVTVGTGP